MVTKVKLVLKGIWKFAIDEAEEREKVFLYQKVAPVIDEELLCSYFMQKSEQRIR